MRMVCSMSVQQREGTVSLWPGHSCPRGLACARLHPIALCEYHVLGQCVKEIPVTTRGINCASVVPLYACRDSDSAPSTPRSMSTSAASSPLRAAPFEAAPRLRFSDDGARRQHWGHSASDPGHREFTARLSSPLNDVQTALPS